MTQKTRILSGVQPTGNLHLGNYLGAIRNWVGLQHQHECFFMLADLHAITVPQDPQQLRNNVRETAAAYIACGIDPEKHAIFNQSAVASHAELMWILSCNTPLGWLNRMTQFKEKIQSSKLDMKDLMQRTGESIKQGNKFINKLSGVISQLEDNENDTLSRDDLTKLIRVAHNTLVRSHALEEETTVVIEDYYLKYEKAKLGLYSYPVLMAADILLYKATHVPVGEDQKQHIELTRDIAGAFNRHYDREFFPIPEPVIMGEATRIMSLRDGTKKMSKSDESDYSRITMTDDADTIALKFRKAKSDMEEGITYDPEKRPEAANLLTIYASLKGITREQAVAECEGKNFSAFKQMLTDVAVAHLSPITRKMRELLDAPDYIDQILARGVAKAREVGGQTVKEAKDLIGFLNV